MTTVRKNNNKKTAEVEVKKERKTPKVKELVPVVEVLHVVEKVTTPLKPRMKKVTAETLETMFNEFDTQLESEIKNKKNREEIKTLKNLRKNVKNLKLASLKLVKVKPKVVRKVNPDAGFFKPVGISQDLAKFTGWNPKETKTRVDATRYICQYIKEHNLQNPGNRREIVPDKNLSQFLKFDSSKNEPLTYSRLQTYMKPHFIKC